MTGTDCLLTNVRLSVVPPSPVTDQIEIEIRGSVRNPGESSETFETCVYLDTVRQESLLYREQLEVPANGVRGFSLRHRTLGWVGKHTLLMEVTAGSQTRRCQQVLEVLASDTRSTRRISGAWVGLLHWSEAEGAYWNPELAQFTAADWREHVRGMHAIGMDTIIIQETWRNPTWYGIHYHQMTEANYRTIYAGRAFYPSSLWPGRMDLPCADPLEAILDETDRLNMQVFLGLGNYAHFDYTPGSLAWHLDVLRELWSLYGHHPSLYGWYVSEELNGWIKPHEMRYWDRIDEFRAEVLTFFETLHGAIRSLAPHTLLMMAPDSHHHADAADTWQQLLHHCDIVCVQGYQRAPADGVPAAEVIRRMQGWCDAAGAHHWIDLEIFGFEHPGVTEPQRESVSRILPDGTTDFIQTPLIPQRMDLIRAELNQLSAFEYVCAYQYPGLLAAPGCRLKPGGTRAVQFYRDYQAYWKRLKQAGISR